MIDHAPASARLGPLASPPAPLADVSTTPGPVRDPAGFASLLRQTQLDTLRADPGTGAPPSAAPAAKAPTAMPAARAAVPPVDPPPPEAGRPAEAASDAVSTGDEEGPGDTPAAPANPRPAAVKARSARADVADPASRPGAKPGKAGDAADPAVPPAAADDAAADASGPTAAPLQPPFDPATAWHPPVRPAAATDDRDAAPAPRPDASTDAAGSLPSAAPAGDAAGAAASRGQAPVAHLPAPAESGRFAATLSALEGGSAGEPRGEASRPVPGAASDGLTGAAGTAPGAGAVGAGTTVTSAASTTAADIPTPVDAPDFAQALGLRLGVLLKDGLQQADLQLNPPELGPVSVQIALDGTQARIDFGADAAATRHAIEAGLPQLASALQDAGFTLAGGGVSQHGGQGGQAGEGRSRGAATRPTLRSADGGTGDDGAALVARAAQRLVRRGGLDLYV